VVAQAHAVRGDQIVQGGDHALAAGARDRQVAGGLDADGDQHGVVLLAQVFEVASRPTSKPMRNSTPPSARRWVRRSTTSFSSLKPGMP
jgi:hypothetical protein